ncbi:MAG: hypothetical protein A2749_02965 [Parcubacteria group bacterium RIFCSPHIGHO2_01_FULL_45_26]|nr:MAG: hypothetical protein A2749_02965 [Parcubacteria group bacterium RIFCSPHIGHO2_01_FULL_45_26]
MLMRFTIGSIAEAKTKAVKSIKTTSRVKNNTATQAKMPKIFSTDVKLMLTVIGFGLSCIAPILTLFLL